MRSAEHACPPAPNAALRLSIARALLHGGSDSATSSLAQAEREFAQFENWVFKLMPETSPERVVRTRPPFLL